MYCRIHNMMALVLVKVLEIFCPVPSRNQLCHLRSCVLERLVELYKYFVFKCLVSIFSKNVVPVLPLGLSCLIPIICCRLCVQACLRANVVLQIDCQGCAEDNDTDGNISKPTRSTLHVQALSHWAPANIGPYSQATQVRQSILQKACE